MSNEPGDIQIHIINTLGSSLYSDNLYHHGGGLEKKLTLKLLEGSYFIILDTTEGRETKKLVIE